MERKGGSPLVSSLPSPALSAEIHFPVERQIGFWIHEPASAHHGMNNIPLVSSNGFIGSAPIGSFGLNGVQKLDCLKSPQPYLITDQKVTSIFGSNSIEYDRSSIPSTASWRNMEQKLSSQRNISMNFSAVCKEGNKVDLNRSHYENGLFSSSLSQTLEKKLRISGCADASVHSIDVAVPHFEENEPHESLEEIEARTIGNLLPDDDELFSGVTDGIDYIAQTNNTDEGDDFDLFSSVGGIELEAEDALSFYGRCKGLDLASNISNGLGSSGSLAGEHPFGEHPSRTLFVRNINSNVEDTELRSLFEQYGDIRALYTACKHRGFVMVSYYDIRSARNALRALQNKPLRRRKLDIHFSIPKDNPSEKDINQGTLVVFNLDSSVSNEDLRHIFGAYGEIKEIRETPHKNHHKFIEFYDVRAADAALRALNRSDIAGKRIKLEPSRPGGARRLIQQLTQDLDLEDTNLPQQQGSHPNNLPPSIYGSHSSESVPVSCTDNGYMKGHNPIPCPIDNHLVDSAFQAFSSSSIIPGLSPPVRVASIGNNRRPSIFAEANHSLGNMNGLPGILDFHPHSLPEYDTMDASVPYSSPSSASLMKSNIFPRPADLIPRGTIHNIRCNGFQSHSFENGNGFPPMLSNHLMWNNRNSSQIHAPTNVMWPHSTSFVNGIPGHSQPQVHLFPSPQAHLLNTGVPSPHHPVGSSPTALWDRRRAFAADSGEPTGFIPGSVGGMGLSNGLHPLEVSPPIMFPHIGGNGVDPSMSSGNVGLPSPNHRSQIFSNRNLMIPSQFESPNERIRGRRNESGNQVDNKKQYELDIESILHGEDTRTTLMIKNIPNKYTSKMLLTAIDERHRGTYDFIYLPIDFKNKCNVGYAFINMIDASLIVPFYEAFNGKKWEKFNSEKVASLAYARIQGKAALIAHFQNSSLMNEDKRCRPILFHTDGPNAGDQEPFPLGLNVRMRPGKQRSSNMGEENEGRSPSNSPPNDESTDLTNTSACSTTNGKMSSTPEANLEIDPSFSTSQADVVLAAESQVLETAYI